MTQSIFSLVVYQPVLNFVYWLYGLCGNNLGLAIIVFTVVFRLALWPLFSKSEKIQKQLAGLQPELKKIQSEHKGNQEELTKAILELYKKHNLSPSVTFTVMAFSFFQIAAMFVFFSLFGALVDIKQIGGVASLLYPAFRGITLDTMFAGINLASHSFILAAVSAITQGIQMFFLSKKQTAAATKLNATMMYFLPLITLAFYRNIYAILYLYWAVFSLVSICQDWKLGHQKEPK
ncbi:MAG: YidC/Oxa1 family membrane protein insertase [Candidatus Parcubacteria bacterium]|nr:YidC/Oxa1 family membrane protein insertase [Candidatus Parcubacteria bacterium]